MSNEVLSQISSKIKTSENSKEMFKNRGNRFACVKMVSAWEQDWVLLLEEVHIVQQNDHIGTSLILQ